MAKIRIEAGATLDTLTQPELDKSLTKFLTSWRAEVMRGVGWRRFRAQGTADATGAVVIGGPTDVSDGTIGPEEGFIWSVTLVNLSNLVSAGTAIARLHVNDTEQAGMMQGNFTVANNAITQQYDPGIILKPGDSLVAVLSSVTAGTIVTLTGQATEVPFNNAWMLT